jgi:hypothetical protein
MEEELELGAKAKNFKTPGRKSFKNAEETVDLEWTIYVPCMVQGSNPADLTLMSVASAVEAVEEAVKYSDTRLKHIATWRAAVDLDTDTTIQMFDVKSGGLTSGIGGRPLRSYWRSRPHRLGNFISSGGFHDYLSQSNQ